MFLEEVYIIRIHIIGGAGSGKSYISQKLSNELNIPYYDLDDIFWDNTANQYGKKTLETERDNKLKQIVEQPSWIIEGVYLKWVTPSFSLADKIFVLKTPISIQEKRIWSRYQKRISGIIPNTKKETIESVKELIKWNKKYNDAYLPDFISNNDMKYKVIQINKAEDIFNYLN
jgi:adenylate kinase family enzyme